MSQETSADEVKAYFSQFGKVEEAVMLMDQQTKRHRGFGFVTFEVGFLGFLQVMVCSQNLIEPYAKSNVSSNFNLE